MKSQRILPSSAGGAPWYHAEILTSDMRGIHRYFNVGYQFSLLVNGTHIIKTQHDWNPGIVEGDRCSLFHACKSKGKFRCFPSDWKMAYILGPRNYKLLNFAPKLREHGPPTPHKPTQQNLAACRGFWCRTFVFCPFVVFSFFFCSCCWKTLFFTQNVP